MEDNMVSLTFVTAMYSNNAEVTSEYDFKVPESWAREYYEKHKEQFSVFADFADFLANFNNADEELCDQCFRASIEDGVCQTNVELNAIGLG